MNRRLWMLLLLIGNVMALPGGNALQQSKPPATPDSHGIEDSRAPLDGDWRGPSTCLVTPSACRDEEALYHIVKIEYLHYTLDASKVVDGKPIGMGTADCHFNLEKQMLHCDFEKGYLDLKLTADRLEGAMFIPDKTRWRDIKLQRQPGKPK